MIQFTVLTVFTGETNLPLHISIIPEKLVHAACKCEKHQCIYKEKLNNINHHSSKAYLKRSQVGVHGKNVHQFQRTENIGCCEKSFGNEDRIPRIPFFAR
ncbi:hypothetical protein X975_20899, partial [Stegodyphus mimosarum]